MIRATVILLTIEDMESAYLQLETIPGLKVLKVKNKLDSELQNLTILFSYLDCIIGEVQMRYCEKPPNYYANHFIYELERSDSA